MALVSKLVPASTFSILNICYQLGHVSNVEPYAYYTYDSIYLRSHFGSNSVEIVAAHKAAMDQAVIEAT